MTAFVLDEKRWTREERDALPDDGSRHELIDGALVVTPSPGWRHQGVVGAVYRLLTSSAGPGVHVFIAPLDVILASDTVVEPDVLVVRDDTLGRLHVEGAPLLAVEVLSPSTRVLDRTLKLSRYERAGTPAYWLVDPEEPRLTAHELRDARYTVVADVAGDDAATLTVPFDVTIIPARLLD
ncbi:MAG: Uma2 family endonuclease [Dermatophilaceae bacterium]